MNNTIKTIVKAVCKWDIKIFGTQRGDEDLFFEPEKNYISLHRII